MSDLDRLKRVFEELRADGYAAEPAFACCLSCGRAALEPEWEDRYVFWHMQDDEFAFGRTIEYEETDPSDFEHVPEDFEFPDQMPFYGDRLTEDLSSEGLYLAYGSEETGHRVCEALVNQGFDVDWDGDIAHRIRVLSH